MIVRTCRIEGNQRYSWIKNQRSYGSSAGRDQSNQLIAKGIRDNAVSPGNTYFEGGIWQNIEKGSPDLHKMAMSLNPTSRMGTPQEVAAGVVFVASPVAVASPAPI
jgi:NAD(P)-dependent dehydrogenase (short-subunit alcohol dehydrogenase family)